METEEKIIPEVCRKLGVVEFSHYWLLQSDVEFRKEFYQFIVPIRSMYDCTQFQQPIDRMLCYCEQFREIKESEKIPTYIVTIHTNKDRIIDSIEVKEKLNN